MHAKTIGWAQAQMVDTVENVLDDPFGYFGKDSPDEINDHINGLSIVGADIGMDIEQMLSAIGTDYERHRLTAIRQGRFKEWNEEHRSSGLRDRAERERLNKLEQMNLFKLKLAQPPNRGEISAMVVLAPDERRARYQASLQRGLRDWLSETLASCVPYTEETSGVLFNNVVYRVANETQPRVVVLTI